MFLIRVQGESEWHPWYNKKEDVFLSWVADEMARKYDRPVDQSELEVHFVEGNQQSHLCKMHNEKGDHTYFQVNNGKVECWEKQADIPPQLSEGDDDPEDPDKKVKKNDPRTKPKKRPDRKNGQDFSTKKCVDWERNPERGRTKGKDSYGNKFTYIDVKKLKGNKFE